MWDLSSCLTGDPRLSEKVKSNIKPTIIKWKTVSSRGVKKGGKINEGQSNKENLSGKRFELLYRLCWIIRLDADLRR